MKKISAWKAGVNLYVEEFVEFLQENNLTATKANLLNGAQTWIEYSYGGCSLIYDADIAERLCSPSELKRKKGGDLQPCRDETWLDVQARALSRAASIVLKGKPINS